MKEREEQTQIRYNQSAQEWLDRSGGKDRKSYWANEMAQFVTMLGTKTRVLEVGCGPATDGKYLTQLGINVVSIDYSDAMLDLARAINPSAILMRMDMQELYFKKDTFNGFWATASLLHLENPRTALKELARVTKKGGLGFISVKEGYGKAVDPKTGYLFHYFTIPEFRRTLERTGFRIIESGKKEGSPNHDWLTFFVQVKK